MSSEVALTLPSVPQPPRPTFAFPHHSEKSLPRPLLSRAAGGKPTPSCTAVNVPSSLRVLGPPPPRPRCPEARSARCAFAGGGFSGSRPLQPQNPRVSSSPARGREQTRFQGRHVRGQKRVERRWTSPVVKETKTTTTVRDYDSSSRMATVQKQNKKNKKPSTNKQKTVKKDEKAQHTCWWGHGELGLRPRWWHANGCRWQALKKNRNRIDHVAQPSPCWLEAQKDQKRDLETRLHTVFAAARSR